MKEENYWCEMRYLDRLRLKQDSLVVEWKETSKSLYIVNQCLGCPVLNEDYSDILSYLQLSFFSSFSPQLWHKIQKITQNDIDCQIKH